MRVHFAFGENSSDCPATGNLLVSSQLPSQKELKPNDLWKYGTVHQSLLWEEQGQKASEMAKCIPEGGHGRKDALVVYFGSGCILGLVFRTLDDFLVTYT